MFSRLPVQGSATLGYHVAGTITRDEVEQMHDEVKEVIAREGRVRLLIEVGELSMPEPMAVIEDLKLTPAFVTDVERFALVGDQRWQAWVTRLTGWLTRGEARHFETREMAAARDWVKGAGG
jgi:hypothetical protein